MANETTSRTQNKNDTTGLGLCDDAAAEGGMTFCELLANRRSIRNYQDRPVSTEVIREMINEKQKNKK